MLTQIILITIAKTPINFIEVGCAAGVAMICFIVGTTVIGD